MMGHTQSSKLTRGKAIAFMMCLAIAVGAVALMASCSGSGGSNGGSNAGSSASSAASADANKGTIVFTTTLTKPEDQVTYELKGTKI